jgi:propionyl-CoA synthetase
VRDNGGHAVALQWSMKNIYGVERDEVFWAASDVGWVVGHSYIVYGPLFNGSTTVLFEGKPIFPDAGVFWRVIKDHNVSVRNQEFNQIDILYSSYCIKSD